MEWRIRDVESCLPDENFLWDTVWINRLNASGGWGDWIMATPSDPATQRGGLRSRSALLTAIMLCLFTDRRLPAGMTPPDETKDPRGWWGDSVKIDGEPDVEMGSLLWTLERGTLDQQTQRDAVDYAMDSLQTILDQGAVARFEVTAEADPARGFLGLTVNAFDRAGDRMFDVTFDLLWRETLSRPQSTFTEAERDIASMALMMPSNELLWSTQIIWGSAGIFYWG